MQSKLYNLSIDFAARIQVEINQTELHSIEQRLASVEFVVKIELIVRLVLLWVRNAIIVVYSIIRFVAKGMWEKNKY